MKERKLSDILDVVFKTIDEFHQSTCMWTHTEHLKQTILDRLNGEEIKVVAKMENQVEGK